MGEGQAVGRPALIGSIIAAAFGIGWIEWGALGVNGPGSIVIRVLGALIGVVLIIRGIRLRRSAREGEPSSSMFANPNYRLIVAVEVIALAAGSYLLGQTHRTEYQIAWFALVVGAHFLGFGRLFAARFYLLGGVLIVAAILGAVLGLAGGSAGLVEAVTGFLSGAALLVMSAVTVVQAQRQLLRTA